LREYIKTYEFTGTLKIEDYFEKENVRCIYKDDYYSNNLMEGHFEVSNLSADLINKLGYFEDFRFEDKSGRIICGKINGVTLNTGNNERKDILIFFVNDFTQWIKYSENKTVKVKISYSIPYISFFSRGIDFSYCYDDSYIFRFSSPKKVLSLNSGDIVFDDWVYSLKDKKPDSIFKKELFIDIEKNVGDEDKKIELLNENENILKDILAFISFILNHRFSFYYYKADFYDEKGIITEALNRKESEWITGSEFIKENNSRYFNFEKLSTMENISLIVNKFLENKNEIDKIKELIYSYLTIKEIKIFEPQFLLAYFLLEGISKLIIKPVSGNTSEQLIKDALSFYNIDINAYNLKVSRNRIKDCNSKLEWEISEFRNNLTHFNSDYFNHNEMYDEFIKMKKLARKLILCYIEPSLSDWPEP
jgi:hypothetical protein